MSCFEAKGMADFEVHKAGKFDTYEDIEKKIGALLPSARQIVYPAGLRAGGNRVSQRARALAPVGEGLPLTLKGAPRKRLRDSIKTVLVGWHYGGRKVKKGAALEIAQQPHAHLVELGHGGPKPAPPHPFMKPAIEDTSGTLRAIVQGMRKSWNGVVRSIARGKITRTTGQALG